MKKEESSNIRKLFEIFKLKIGIILLIFLVGYIAFKFVEILFGIPFEALSPVDAILLSLISGLVVAIAIEIGLVSRIVNEVKNSVRDEFNPILEQLKITQRYRYMSLEIYHEFIIKEDYSEEYNARFRIKHLKDTPLKSFSHLFTYDLYDTKPNELDKLNPDNFIEIIEIKFKEKGGKEETIKNYNLIHNIYYDYEDKKTKGRTSINVVLPKPIQKDEEFEINYHSKIKKPIYKALENEESITFFGTSYTKEVKMKISYKGGNLILSRDVNRPHGIKIKDRSTNSDDPDELQRLVKNGELPTDKNGVIEWNFTYPFVNYSYTVYFKKKVNE